MSTIHHSHPEYNTRITSGLDGDLSYCRTQVAGILSGDEAIAPNAPDSRLVDGQVVHTRGCRLIEAGKVN